MLSIALLEAVVNLSALDMAGIYNPTLDFPKSLTVRFADQRLDSEHPLF